MCCLPEIWKKVPLHENYEVSTLSRIRNAKTGRILSQSFDKDGYLKISITHRLSKKLTFFRTHRLVAIAFIPNPLNKAEINHLDKDRANPIVTNLEWATHQENIDYIRKKCIK